MDMTKIEVFLAVAKHLGFRDAAAELDLSPAAVTKAIQRMEEELGVALLVRSTRSVALTSVGEQLRLTFIPLHAHYQQTMKEVRDIVTMGKSTINLAFFSALSTDCAVDTITSHIKEQFPGIKLQVRAGELFEIVGWLENGAADICFTEIQDYALPHRWSCFALTKIFRTVPARVVVSKSHPWAREGPLTAQGMQAGKMLLLHEKNPQLESVYYELACESKDYVPSIHSFLATLERGDCFAVSAPAIGIAEDYGLTFLELPPQYRFSYCLVGLYSKSSSFLVKDVVRSLETCTLPQAAPDDC